MQLTNFSFLNARNDFLESIAKRKVAADRIETGKRLEQTTKDLGAISQASKQKLAGLLAHAGPVSPIVPRPSLQHSCATAAC